MKSLFIKIVSVSFALMFAITLQAAVTNVYFANTDLASLPYQPLSSDLAQGADASKIIVAGGMHPWAGLQSNFFAYLFNSPADGDLGVGCPQTIDGKEVILSDASPPGTLTLEMNCNFTTTKMIRAVHVFSRAGDARLFTYGEVYFCSNGVDYESIGAVSFGEWGESTAAYTDKYCLASLEESDTNQYLAENIISLKIIFRGVMDATDPWTNMANKILGSNGGSVIGEIDILGTDGNLPPPPPPPVETNTIYVGTLGVSNGSNYFTTIQDAVDAATAGTLILVSNGIYNTGGAAGEDGSSPITNRVLCTKGVVIQSISGPANTIIVGAPDPVTGDNGPGAIRCVCFPWDSGATISGFTLSNGYTLTSGDANRERGGGGARIRRGGVITNCIIVDCTGNGFGGGVNLQWGTAADCEIYNNYTDYQGGGIFSQGGNIYNCNIHDNESDNNAGGVMFYSVGGSGGSINNSIISDNISGEKGGGVYLLGNPGDPNTEDAKVFDCLISNNIAAFWGGGVNVEFGGDIYRAIIQDNECQGHSGGGIYFYRGGKVYDSLICKNRSMNHGGGIFFDNVSDTALAGGEAYNCTIVDNIAIQDGGGINMANSTSNYFGKIVNSIIYYNTANSNTINWSKGPNGSSPFNCTTGPVGGLGDAASGNITNAPEFVSISNGNWRLLPFSPCINAGTNGEVTTTIDLDGNPRIAEGTVNMGCYESIPEPVIFGLFTVFALVFLKNKFINN